MLHITNGDCAAELLREAAIGGDILPWRDVLHEGPVPDGLTLEELSATRAAFISEKGWGPPEEVSRGFRERDARLAAFREHEEIVLWFEHDLYDQLQLLQLLDWFSRQALGATALGMICVGDYLGTMRPERLAALHPQRRPVTSQQLNLGQRAWSAFRSPDPLAWQRLTAIATDELPYLAGAVFRHLEQYPSARNGTSRTEAALLAAVASGIGNPGRIFEATQVSEERRFMGDAVFWHCLEAMVKSRPPLLVLRDGGMFRAPGALPRPEEFNEQDILITEAGRKVHGNESDWIAINGIDKWLGGVHLERDNVWRWDSEGGRLARSRS